MPDASLDKPPLPTRLADYRPPDFLIDEVALDFDLGDTETLVKSHLQLRRNPEAATAAAPLRLDGEELALVAISLDGDPLAPGDYALEADGTLVIANVPDAFALDITARIHPETNTQLSGLYMSGGNYCTQCEPEGFRRITWFLDRPDVMSRFTVTIRADKSRYPVLLSNGNPSGSGDLADGRHFAKWVDPHPKPSYLFALVAGGERPSVEADREERQFLAIEAQWRSGGRRLGIAAQSEMRFDESLGIAEVEIERDLIDQKIGRAVIGKAGRKRRLVERGVGHDNGTIGGVI